jgi:Ca2+-binding EF-hand superfamily protein
MRNFKYFDLDNSGAVSTKEFQSALTKIGIQFKSADEMWAVFKHYDANGNGELEYKEFASILFGKDQGSAPQRQAKDLLPAVRDKLK